MKAYLSKRIIFNLNYFGAKFELNFVAFLDNSVIPEFQYQFKQPDQQLTYIGRTCVQYFTGNECDHGRDTKTGQAIVVCRHHCSTDGCNASSNLSGNNLVMTMMMIVFGFISLFGINV